MIKGETGGLVGSIYGYGLGDPWVTLVRFQICLHFVLSFSSDWARPPLEFQFHGANPGAYTILKARRWLSDAVHKGI